MKKQSVKLEDVAALAGVSKTTVSRVLNNRGYLSQATIDKVHQAMEELHYRPNVIARQLYQQRTKLVGLVFPTVDNPFFGQLEARLDWELYQRGYRVLMGNSQNNPKREKEYLRQLLNGQVDGLIVGAHNQGIKQYRDTQLPIVSIERWVSKDIPVVAADNYAGGVLAVDRLLKDGCQHIIHTNYPHGLPSPNLERRRAYEELMQKHHRQSVTYEVNFDSSVDEKLAIFRRLFDEHPEVDGIFADNDTNASLIMQVARERGLKVPADLKVVGFDGANMTRTLLPELTTVQQPIDRMAATAVELLQERINGKQINNKSIQLPVKLIEGITA
ncbi:LacI family DNA-binding transcriptional regulator [Limosilactobacillus viscerum]|uniref:LacI family DNA-binding transcriptional regulator n=1 Tax=Limosilactobacillus viscerum TaxID=2993450 RepID=UPI0024B9EC51|nr:LacI family DNA-binding transcriptional regulator [Limosilactobacillus viscerum]